MLKNSLIFIIAIVCFICGIIDSKAQNKNNNCMVTSNLDPKEAKIVTISAFTARGELDKLNTELNAGLDAGLTINEIKEIIVQTYAYCGFPRAIRGLQTFMEALDNRKANGISDDLGRESSFVTDTRPKYDRGKEILAELQSLPVPEGRPTSGYGAFSPEIDTFLKEHLFADIFERDVLTYTQREIVTVSVLMSLDGVEPMLKSHMILAINVGITPDQLHEMIQIVGKNVSKQNADIAKLILAEVLKSKNLN